MFDEPSDAPLDELMAVMAHDLNNPLAALVTNLSFLESAIRPVATTDAIEALDDAQMLCDMLRRLIGNLDLVARREAASTGPSSVDLAVIVRDAVGRLGKQAAAAEVSLAVSASLRFGEAFVLCDREFLARALDNLLAFAIERSPTGSHVDVTVESASGERRVLIRHRSRPDRSFGEDKGPERVARRRRLQATYGRGLALYCVRIAGLLVGGRFEETRRDGQTVLTFAIPEPERR